MVNTLECVLEILASNLEACEVTEALDTALTYADGSVRMDLNKECARDRALHTGAVASAALLNRMISAHALSVWKCANKSHYFREDKIFTALITSDLISKITGTDISVALGIALKYSDAKRLASLLPILSKLRCL